MPISQRVVLALVAFTLVIAAGVSTSAWPSAGGTAKPASRAMSVDDAMKELDLIRPARQKAAHDFTVRTDGGTTFRLSEQRGKMVLVNFWATWCAPCREEMPAMERLYRAHKDAGFVIVAVSVDSGSGVVTSFVREHKLSFPIALDPKMEIANAYGVRALPASFIVDREGGMAALALGPRAWDTRAAHALVQGMVR